MNMFGGRSHFGMLPRTSGTKRKSLNLAAPTEQQAESTKTDVIEASVIEAVGSAPREKQADWTKRGLFKAGFNTGAPRLRGARLFTKGKVR
jgi:hypothetical protein